MNIDFENYGSAIEMKKNVSTWRTLVTGIDIAIPVSISQVAISSEGQPIARSGKHCPSGYRKVAGTAFSKRNSSLAYQGE